MNKAQVDDTGVNPIYDSSRAYSTHPNTCFKLGSRTLWWVQSKEFLTTHNTEVFTELLEYLSVVITPRNREKDHGLGPQLAGSSAVQKRFLFTFLDPDGEFGVHIFAAL